MFGVTAMTDCSLTCHCYVTMALIRLQLLLLFGGCGEPEIEGWSVYLLSQSDFHL
jgi:hypothetical protein